MLVYHVRRFYHSKRVLLVHVSHQTILVKRRDLKSNLQRRNSDKFLFHFTKEIFYHDKQRENHFERSIISVMNRGY